MLIDDEIACIQGECEAKLTEEQIEVVRKHMARYVIAGAMDREVQQEALRVAWGYELGPGLRP